MAHHIEDLKDHSVLHDEKGVMTASSHDEVARNMSLSMVDVQDVISGAAQATQAEHDMTIWEAVRLYPKAIAFSTCMSFALIMEGYDTSLTGSFFGLGVYNRTFGSQLADGTYQLSASWQGGLLNGVQVGEILGLAAAGIITDRFGYRKTLSTCLIALIGFIFIFFFAQNVEMLLAAGILCGIPWGMFQVLTTTYAADVTPVVLRPYLTSFVNICWVVGQFIASGVLRGMSNNETQWAWRIPYAIQWIWPIPILVAVILAPESPWWLVRKGRLDDAKVALRSLTTRGNDKFNVDDTIAMMVFTTEQEKASTEGATYRDCFRGTDLRRTEITCMVWMIQVWSGIWLGGNGVYFYEQAGLSQDSAFSLQLGQNGIAIFGTLLSWVLIPRMGRRTLYLMGMVAMCAVLLTIGFLAIPQPTTGIQWASGSMLLVYVFFFDFTVGPVCYSLVAEIPSTRLRVKTAVLARNCYAISSIIANLLNPRFLNPGAWNLKGKAGFFWAGTCFLCLVWAYFRLPEPKGLTSAELNTLFENKISARKFRTVEVDPFSSFTHLESEANVPSKAEAVTKE